MTQLDPQILAYLKRFMQRRRIVAFVASLGSAICFSIACILLGCIADRLIHLDKTPRLIWLTVTLAGSLWILHKPILAFFRPIDWLAAADQVEAGTRRFNERLQTVTSQMISHPESRGSSSMLATLTSELRSDIQTSEPASLVSSKPAAIPCVIAGILAAAMVSLTFIPSLQFRPLLARTTNPWSAIPPVTTTHLTVQADHDPQITIHAHADHFDDNPPTIAISADGLTWHRALMTPISAEDFVYSIGPATRNLQYFIEADDARSEVFEIRAKGN